MRLQSKDFNESQEELGPFPFASTSLSQQHIKPAAAATLFPTDWQNSFLELGAWILHTLVDNILFFLH